MRAFRNLPDFCCSVAPFVALIGLAVWLLYGCPARAHLSDHERWTQLNPRVQQWFMQQSVPGGPSKGGHCCNMADAEEVEEDIRNGEYWIRSEHFVEWTRVPSDAVLDTPNLYGQPVVWVGITAVNPAPHIRCYAPGAKG